MKRQIKHLIENDEIDRMLSREDDILPSSGFAASVMDAVRREAAAPPPIPFPWKRALPGLVVAGVVLAVILIAGVVVLAESGRATTRHFSTAVPSIMPPLFNGGIESASAWTVLALLLAFVSVKLSMRLTSGRA
jgi:hypothetical protein